MSGEVTWTERTGDFASFAATCDKCHSTVCGHIFQALTAPGSDSIVYKIFDVLDESGRGFIELPLFVRDKPRKEWSCGMVKVIQEGDIHLRGVLQPRVLRSVRERHDYSLGVISIDTGIKPWQVAAAVWVKLIMRGVNYFKCDHIFHDGVVRVHGPLTEQDRIHAILYGHCLACETYIIQAEKDVPTL